MDEKRLQEIMNAVNKEIAGRWHGEIPLPVSVFDEAVQRIREYNYPKRNEEIASMVADDTENRKLVRELLAEVARLREEVTHLKWTAAFRGGVYWDDLDKDDDQSDPPPLIKSLLPLIHSQQGQTPKTLWGIPIDEVDMHLDIDPTKPILTVFPPRWLQAAEDWWLTADQTLYMMRHNNTFYAEDVEAVRELADSEEFKRLFGTMGIDEAIDRYKAMLEDKD